MIRRYVVDGNTYIDIPKWKQHQKIERPTPSRLPPFTEDSPRTHRGLTEDSPRTHRGVGGDSSLDQGSGIREGEGEGEGEAEPPPEAKAPPDGVTKAPKTLRANGHDLYLVLRGMLKSFGKDHGIACLDAALQVYDHQTITAAIKAAYTSRGEVVPADDVMAVCRSYADQRAKPKLTLPDRLPPLIDVAALKQGIMRPARQA